MKVCETTNYIDNIQIQPPSRLERWVLTRLKRHLAKVDGCLLLTLPSGTQHQFGKGDPVADLRIHTLKAFLRMFLGGANGWAESYIAGEWDSNNIGKLVQWALTNELHLADMSKASFVIQTLHNHYHARRENTKAGSKRNI
ncbi:MAG: SAM-dependent methyltransferase, partial [Pontibacterium sp.]